MKAAAAADSKEEANMTANAPTADASDQEVRGGNEKNQEKGGIKDIVTHSSINEHRRYLISGAGAKDDDTDKTKEYTPPCKKRSRESKKRKKYRKNKEKDRSHPFDPYSPPQSLRKFNYQEREN